jgi:hypothetical protein
VSSLTNSDPVQWPNGLLLTAALRQVQSTLRELDINMSLYSLDDYEQLPILPVSGQLGPLREFSHLRKLKAPIVTLLGWWPEKCLRLAEVLPTGLTHLGLTEDLGYQWNYEWRAEFVLKELAVFMSVWRSVTPDLQVVEFWLEMSGPFGPWTDVKLAQLRMMCQEAGVLCTVHCLKELSSSCSPMAFQWVRQGPDSDRAYYF